MTRETMLSNSFIGYAKHCSTPKLVQMARVARQRLKSRLPKGHRPIVKEVLNYLDHLLLERFDAETTPNAMREAIAQQLNFKQLNIVFE